MSSIKDNEVFFFRLGNEITKTHECMAKRTKLCRFVNMFGAKPKALAVAWHLLQKESYLRNGLKRKHLLMAMCYLKRNISESEAHALFEVDEKTYRGWRNYVVEKLARLRVVSALI